MVIIVTGAAGFLGSAITVDLARTHRVVAIDQRAPSDALKAAAVGSTWHRADVSDGPTILNIFRETREHFGDIDTVVHFAAFYHFGTDWCPEYDRTNIRGTETIVKSACKVGVKRIIFASSVAAMLPPMPGRCLTEESPTSDYIPYAKSKSIGEGLHRSFGHSQAASQNRC